MDDLAMACRDYMSALKIKKYSGKHLVCRAYNCNTPPHQKKIIDRWLSI